MSKHLTAKRLRHLLDYDPITGLFVWRNPPNTNPYLRGHVTGSITTDGYLRITIDGKSYAAHRLAHLYMTGEFPENEVDHINRIPSDNRWENLRDATRQQNCVNKLQPNNTSGRKGVSWYKKTGKWKAQITANGKRYGLGYYNDIEDAAVAYKNIARILHGEFNHFGEQS